MKYIPQNTERDQNDHKNDLNDRFSFDRTVFSVTDIAVGVSGEKDQ